MKNYRQLFEKHRHLFTGDRDGLGFECKTGWYGILDDLMAAIGSHLKQNPSPGFKVVQIKEKFGKLCFYVHGGDEHIDKLIYEAEQLSRTTCEECGSASGKPRNGHGWLSTTCDACFAKKEKRITGY